MYNATQKNNSENIRKTNKELYELDICMYVLLLTARSTDLNGQGILTEWNMEDTSYIFTQNRYLLA